MIGTRVRVGQDISFPRQTVFPQDTSYSGGNRGLMLRRRSAGRPFGVPGARVAGEPELGDIADTIGGGAEVLGPGQEQGFPGGATFIPPPPFPEQPESPETDEFARALALGKAGLGVASKLVSLRQMLTPKAPGTAQPFTRDEGAFQEQRAGERANLGNLGDVGDVLGGATQVPEFDEFGLAFESSFNPVPGGATQVPASDLETNFQGTDGAVDADGGFGLGDIAGGAAAAVGIAGAILSDRPIEQKAAISAVSAGQVAAPAIAGAVGGAAAASTATTVAGGVGLALSLALLGEALSKGDDPDATEAQRTAANREKNKAIASATASLISLGGVLLVGGPAGGAVGAVLSIGLAIDSIARMLDAQTQGPPVGANWTEYKSIMIGQVLADKLPETFERADNPLQLLGMALAGPALAPNGEIQISHDSWGLAGSLDDPASSQIVENITKIAATGDPDLLREFIRGVHIKTGASGATQDDWLLTDTYRRTLVSLLPASHSVRQEAEAGTSDLFGPIPPEYSAAGGIEQFIESQHTGVGSYTAYQQPAMAIADMIQRLQAGETPQYLKPAQYGTAETPYRNWSPSPLFRQPGELELSPEQRAHYISVLQSMLPPAGPSRVLNPETGGYLEAPPVDAETYWQNYQPWLDPTYYFGPGGFNL